MFLQRALVDSAMASFASSLPSSSGLDPPLRLLRHNPSALQRCKASASKLHVHGRGSKDFLHWQKGQARSAEIYGRGQVAKAVNGRQSRGSDQRIFEVSNKDTLGQERDSFTESTSSTQGQHERISDTVDMPDLQQGRSTAMFEEQHPSAQPMARNFEGARVQLSKKTIGNEGEDPYRILRTGRKVYLDELDVLTLLDPPSFLHAMDANNYNQASFLWKKIGDIPEERRHRLLDLLTPRHIANMWEITGQRYEESGFSPEESESLLLGSETGQPLKPVVWSGKLTGVPWPLDWISRFKKVFFLGNDGSVYGRVITGGWLLEKITSWLAPLYLEVRHAKKVIATEEPCDIAFEYDEGQLHLVDIPVNFPKPAKHPWPFNDQSFDYIRPVGPGVLVGQWWHEGRDLEQIPQKYGEFVMIKDYSSNTGEL